MFLEIISQEVIWSRILVICVIFEIYTYSETSRIFIQGEWFCPENLYITCLLHYAWYLLKSWSFCHITWKVVILHGTILLVYWYSCMGLEFVCSYVHTRTMWWLLDWRGSRHGLFCSPPRHSLCKLSSKCCPGTRLGCWLEFGPGRLNQLQSRYGKPWLGEGLSITISNCWNTKLMMSHHL